MFRCPDCREQLIRESGDAHVFWACPHSHGRAVTFAALKSEVDPVFAKELWRKVRDESFPQDRSCPDCQKPMYCINAVGDSQLTLDACKVCTFLWLDFGDLDGIPFKPKPKSKHLSAEARKSAALLEADDVAARLRDYNEQIDKNRPDKLWKYVPAVFGLPIELKGSPMNTRPIVTWALSLLVVLTSVLAFYEPGVFALLALVPADLRLYTLFSSFLLHGGWLHLIGNLYFFMTFGDDVEHYLGHLKYLVLILVSTLAGSIAHVLTHSGSFVPAIGASDGIAGILAFYAIILPRARLVIRFAALFIPVPAWVAMVLWLVFQLWGAFSESDQTVVAYFAHLGGALGGVIFWVFIQLVTRTNSEAKS